MDKLFKGLLTPEQARAKAGFKSVWTIYRHIKRGNLKAVKLHAKHFFIEEKELNNFIKKHKK